MGEIPYEPESESPTPSQEIARLLAEQDEDIGFDPETCDEVANLPTEEAFETAYSYLTQAGLDADTLLASFIEPEEGNTA